MIKGFLARQQVHRERASTGLRMTKMLMVNRMRRTFREETTMRLSGLQTSQTAVQVARERTGA
jgi:hypothetical protein